MKRPTSVTVFGILNIVFSVFGMCGLALTLAQPTIQQAFQDAVKDAGQEVKEDPLQKAVAADPNLKLLQKITTGSNVVSTLVLLIAGIALLLMKPWGRTLSICFAIYDLLSKIVFSVLSYRAMMKIIAAQEPAADAPPADVLGGIFAAGFGCSLIFLLVYPILLLIFMLRPTVAAAFGAPGDVDHGDTMQIIDDDQFKSPMA